MKIFSITLLIGFYCFSLAYSQPDSLNYQVTKVRKKVLKIAYKIDKGKKIHSRIVGFERTTQYENFVKLIEKSTTNELLALMHFPSPAVRGYSFWALAKRNYNDLETVFITHANDEEKIMVMDGCFAAEMALIEFMSWVVKPRILDLNCKKLGKAAFQKMHQKNEGIYKKNKE